jgi:hypothetical protein
VALKEVHESAVGSFHFLLSLVHGVLHPLSKPADDAVACSDAQGFPFECDLLFRLPIQ